MATYNVTDQTSVRRVQFTGNNSAGPFAFAFQVNATSEIKVYVDTTVKTESSHYTVSLNAGTGAGTISFTSGNHPTNSQTITILGSIPLSRTSVYTTGGQLTATSLESDFDTNMFVHQQTNEEINRSLRLAEHDTISGADMTLPVKATRLGKLLGFNSSTGNPEATFTITDGTTITSISSSITTVAGISSNVTSVAGVASNVTTVAGIASNVTTVAGISSAVSTVAGISSAVSSAGTNATLAQNYANKVDGAVESSNYSSKAWAIGGTGVTDTSGAGSAKSWAVEADAVDGTEHSSKTYAISGSTLNAGSAKNWALGGGDSFSSSTTVGNTGLYSAKYWAEQSALSKTEFSNIYQGTHSSDPSGGSVSAGDLYFNSSSNVLKFYTGSAWSTVEATDTSNLATNGFAVAMAIAL
jgi:hypothetical protein